MSRPALLAICLGVTLCGCQSSGARTAYIDRPQSAGFWSSEGQSHTSDVRTVSAEGSPSVRLARRSPLLNGTLGASDATAQRIPMPRVQPGVASGRLATIEGVDAPIGAF